MLTTRGTGRIPVRIYDNVPVMRFVDAGYLAAGATNLDAVGVVLVEESDDDLDRVVLVLPIGSGGARAFATALETATDRPASRDVAVTGVGSRPDLQIEIGNSSSRTRVWFRQIIDVRSRMAHVAHMMFVVDHDWALVLADAVRAADRYVAAQGSTQREYADYLARFGTEAEIEDFDQSRFGARR